MPYWYKIAVKMTKQFRLHTQLNRHWICNMQRPARLHTFLPQVHTTNNLCPVLCNTQIHKTAKRSLYILWVANTPPNLKRLTKLRPANAETMKPKTFQVSKHIQPWEYLLSKAHILLMTNE
jgi:hypothetical protein